MDSWPSSVFGGALPSRSEAVLGGGGTLTAADGAAMTMLVVVALVGVLVGCFAWTLIRRSRRPNRTLEFLDHLDRAGETAPPGRTRNAATPSENGGAPWQRAEDWWKR